MKLIKLAVLGLALGVSGAMAQDCTAPESPAVPDGSSASLEEMQAGLGAVRSFQSDNADYLECLQPALDASAAKAGAEEASDEDRAAHAALVERHNTAVEHEKDLAATMNAEIRKYKEANPD